MTLAHQTQKGNKAATAASLGRDILESDPESVASGKREKEDDVNLESNQKREKSSAARIGRPLKFPSRNEDGDYEDEEEESSPSYKYNEGREGYLEEDRLYKRE